ncbi:MAG: rhomboid family intramembrane serine protease [Phycisphaerae bacterium]
MGWQDRDYARNVPRGGASYASAFGGRPGPRSIVTTLIVINVAIWFLFQPTTALYRLMAMQTQAVLHGQIWRLFTAQYLHAGGTHLLFNMIGLYFLGRALERVWSPTKFVTIYTLAGLAGNLMFMLISALGWFGPLGQIVPLVGASGCILGLLGAAAVMFPRAEVYVYFLFPIKIRTAAIIFGALYALNIWQRGANAGGDAAHLAGMAFGVWWAARGERWWAGRGARTFSKVARPFAGIKPARKSPFQRKIDTRKADAQLIDRLLAKVYDGGLHSLTPAERRQLTEATDRQRQAEQAAGRVDRL